MKYAVIAPVPDTCGLMSMTSYHLVIASEVVRKPRRWSILCMRWRRRGDFIILDNGAVEGGAMPLDDILDIAEDIRPDEIVLPDVLGDAEATLRLIHDERDAIEKIPAGQRMFVAQGRTMDEWEFCFRHPGCEYHTIGIPKRVLGAQPKDRFRILWALKNLDNRHPIHLLGFLGNPLNDLANIRRVQVPIRGVDSAAPVAWAQNGCDFTYDGPFSVDLRKPLRTPEQYRSAANMIELLREACDGVGV